MRSHLMSVLAACSLAACAPSMQDEVSEAAVDGGSAPTLPDAREDVGTADAGVVLGESGFSPGVLGASGPGTTGSSRPARVSLRALPGGGVGRPVLTSNNPEAVTGVGVLYTNRGPSPTRGGQATILQGEFGIYLHHLNQSGSAKAFSILITNPNATPVEVSLRGSGYSQGETGGVGLGLSPDYRVSRDWIRDQPATTTGTVTLASARGAVLWTKSAANNQEVDGRFTVSTNGPVYVYIVMAVDGSLQKALEVSQPLQDAPGDYRISGTPPPPFGREAGVYAHDTWRSVFDVEIPAGPRHLGLMVNTATGGGLPQVQAFPALAHYTQSAAEAVGMYGNVYEFDVGLRLASGTTARRVRVAFHSLANGTASRWWDGAAILDDQVIDIRHVPGDETTTLFDAALVPGETRRVRLRAMVPGLAAIPQALTIESF